MNKALMCLALERIIELGQQTYSAHEQLEKWREKPLEGIERTQWCLMLKNAIEEQRKWAQALIEELEGEE